jgi:RNA polymerase sigma factor (sigma-70 family)
MIYSDISENRWPCERAVKPQFSPPPDWTDLVRRIRNREPSGMEELYQVFARGIRFYLCRHIGQEALDDRVHDTFLIVVQAIRRGELRDPERLMGFVRTVVRRQIAAHIESAVRGRSRELELRLEAPVRDAHANPEQRAIDRQHAEWMHRVLARISKRDREILTRFYLLEQSPDRICREMHLNETQFRLLKSRAKSRFGALGRRKLNRAELDAGTRAAALRRAAVA